MSARNCDPDCDADDSPLAAEVSDVVRGEEAVDVTDVVCTDDEVGDAVGGEDVPESLAIGKKTPVMMAATTTAPAPIHAPVCPPLLP